MKTPEAHRGESEQQESIRNKVTTLVVSYYLLHEEAAKLELESMGLNLGEIDPTTMLKSEIVSKFLKQLESKNGE